ncbi:MAG: FHIPEP family type III secretion protein, partial [Cyanobacteria bacterium HKST-UBA06]|nr:FHIPEP family type III secretion protein [Cyanobacteria bacterium HKST-UBA06]
MEQLQRILKHKDIMLSVAIALMIGMLVLPIPPMLVDILLTVNLALSVTMMMVTIYTNEPLQYSTFPTILLVATLFRLGMNVSTTRLILTTAQGGEVIEAFGNFVVGGNYLVGVLIFIILVVINFIVITNGAGRVAEVAARFTLD